MKFPFFTKLLGLFTLSACGASAQAAADSAATHRFEGKVVIVTGASKGIGRGIAQTYAKEGAKLVLVARDLAALQVVKEGLGLKEGDVLCLKGDVSVQNDMEAMAEAAVAHFGKIDILCHNAGIYPQARLEKMTLEEWQHVIDVNLTGTFLSVKACLPTMIEQKCGKIVIISSISGPQTAFPGFSHYAASKAGVSGFVRTAAVELAKYGINVNAVEPGNIMAEGLVELGEEHINNMLKPIPLGRLGTPEDVAQAVLFLSSGGASYITGQSIIVDGGQTLPESHFVDY